MSEVEDRIVKLSMDSRNLEKNAKTSIETLKKLDDALKFSGAKDSIANLETSINQVDFSVLSNNVDQINKRFSAFGIASGTVIANITNRMTNFGLQMLNAINPVTKAIGVMNAGLNQIKTGGWGRATKIDQAKFKIEGLGNAWEDVQKQINYGVSDTAYGLDQAANAAAQLIASGLTYDKELKNAKDITEENADDLSKTLLAISGVAAMTSADYDLLADVFIDAAAAGKVTADTFNRISAQGLNAKATLGEALGKTQQEIDEMSRKGQISFKAFADAMYDAYHTQAKKSNETLEGALANMKAALSRIGAEFATPLRVFWRDVYNSTRLKIKELKTILDNAGIFTTFTEIVERADSAITKIIDSVPVSLFQGIADGANMALNVVSNLVDVVDRFASMLPGATKEQEKAAEDVVNTTAEAVMSEEELLEMANKVIRGDYGNGEDVRRSALGKNFELIQNKVNELLDCSFRYDVVATDLNKTSEELAETTADSAAEASKYADSQSALAEATEKAKDKFKGFTSTIKKAAIMIRFKKIITGVSSAFDMLKATAAAVLNGAIDPIISIADGIATAFLDAGAAIGTWLTNFSQTLLKTGFYERVQLTVNSLLTKFNGLLTKAGKVGRITFEVITNTVGKAKSVIAQAKTRLGEFWEAFKETEGYNRLSTSFTSLKEQIIALKDSALASLEQKLEEFMGKEITFPEFNADSFVESVSEKVIWLLDKIEEIKKAIMGFFTPSGEDGTLRSSVLSFFSNDEIGENADGIASGFDNVKQAIFDFLSQFTENRIQNFKDFVSLMGEVLEVIGGAVGSALKGGINALNDFINGIIESPPNVDGIIKLVLNVVNFITKIKGTLALWGILDSVGAIGDGLNSVANILRNVNRVVRRFWGVLRGVKRYFFSLARENNADALFTLSKAVIVFAGAMMLLGNLTWDQLYVAAAAIGVITVALFILMTALSKFSVRGPVNPVQALSNVLLGYKKVVKDFLSDVGRAATIAALAVAVATIGSVFMKLLDIPWSDAKVVIKILGALMAELALTIFFLNRISGKGSIANALSIVALAFTIKTIVNSMTELSDVGSEQLKEAAKVVLAVGAAIAAVLFVMRSKVGKDGVSGLASSFKNVLLIVAIAGVLLVAAESLTKLASIPAEDLNRAIIGLVGVIGSLAILLFSSRKMFGGGGSIASTITNFLALGGLIAVIFAVLYGMQDFDTYELSAAVSAITDILKILALLMFVTSKFGGNTLGGGFKDILKGTGSDLLLVGKLMLIVAAVVGLASFLESVAPSLDKLITSSVPLLTAVGEALGGLIGGFVKGVLVDPYKEDFSLANLSKSITDFVNDLKPLTDGSVVGDTSGLDNIIALIWKIASAEFATVVTNAVGIFLGERGLLTLSDKLPIFAASMVMYSWAISLMNSKAVERTENAVNIILALADAVPNEGGLLGKIMGENDPKVFGEKLKPFAEGLVDYSKAIKPMKDEAVMRTKAAVEVILALATKIPNEGGLWGAIMGENDPAKFGLKLVPFASGLTAYSWAIWPMKEDAVIRTQTAANVILELAAAIPNEGGLYGAIMGENDPSKFGSKLVPFAEGLVTYSYIIELLKDDAVTKSKKAVDTIIELSKSIPDTGGLLGILLGDNDMETFGSQLTAFATSVVDYAGMVDDADFDKATKINGAVQEILTLADQIYTWESEGRFSFSEFPSQMADLLGGLFEYLAGQYEEYEGTDLFAEFGESIYERIVDGIKASMNEGSGMNLADEIFSKDIESQIAKKAEVIAKAFVATLGATLVEEKSGDNSIITKMTNLFSVDIVPACIQTLTDSVPNFTAAMGMIVEGMRRTAQGLGWRLKSALQTALSSAVSTVRNYYSNFKSAGTYLMEGLAKGVTDNADKVATAMDAAAKTGKRLVEKDMGIRSPSKVMMLIGRYIMEGWAIGIRDNAVLTNKAASNSAISLIQTMSSSVHSEAESKSQELYNSLLGMYQYVNYAINEALDTQPTITPVMDLSMIQNGVNGINGMFGNTYGFGVNGIGYARSMYPSSALNASIQAKTQPVTASAIQGIREDIRFLGDSISKMQMVMDSGVLVGTIGGGMDRELGSIQKMRERWA